MYIVTDCDLLGIPLHINIVILSTCTHCIYKHNVNFGKLVVFSFPPQSVMSPNELPCQQVDNAVIRNLSQELASWKFPARALGLQEAEIDLIRLDNQCDTREQCYKMLQLWVQRYWQNATYQTLGRALQSEARDVYPKYVDIVSSFLS